LRGVGAELDGGLIGNQSKVGQKVTHFLFASVDDLTGGRLVNGVGHVLTELLEASAELFQQSIRRQGRFGRHGLLLERKATGNAPH